MQYGTTTDVYDYTTTNDTHAKLMILSRAAQSGLGKPLFVTTPIPATRAPAMRCALLLAIRDSLHVDGQAKMIMMCHVLSDTQPQGGTFVLHHASMREADYAAVTQVMPIAVFPCPLSLLEAVWKQGCDAAVAFDAHYGLNDDTRATLSESVARTMEWHFPGREEAHDFVRVYLASACTAGWLSYGILGPTLVRAIGDNAPEVVEPVRAVALARALFFASLSEAGLYLFETIHTGSCEYSGRQAGTPHSQSSCPSISSLDAERL